MPTTGDFPAIYVDDVPPAARSIAELPTGIALFIGVAAHGPTGVALRVDGIDEFRATFGPSDATHTLGDAIAHYVANGGQVAWVIALDEGLPGSATFGAAALECFDAGGPVDVIDVFDLLCVPGESDPAVQAALQACCATRHVFYIADCAADETASALAMRPDPNIVGPHASQAALYAPWLIATDAAGVSRACPPSPFVAGAYALGDRLHGMWRSHAADATLVGATDLALATDRSTNDAIRNAGINPVTMRPGGGLDIQEGRTLASAASDQQQRSVPMRRLMLHIERCLDAGLAWTVFEPNDERTWSTVRASTSAFLEALWCRGAFIGTTFAQAAFVRCDRTTMSPSDIDAGRLILEVGVAPRRPAEFVIVRWTLETAG